MSFSQDPWRPGAAVQPPASEPERKDPPKADGDQLPAETPQEAPETPAQAETPADDETADDDELERALAEMRGDT